MTLPKPVEGLTLRDDGPLIDRFGRVHTYMRVSVTDRCNYRCTYCLPEEGAEWLDRDELLTFEEITRIVSAMAAMGVRRVRLTGGEPTIRRDLDKLVAALAAVEGIDDLSMTTNGHHFAAKAEHLAACGLQRLNVSLDTLDADKFREVTRGGDVVRVLAAIDAAVRAGLTPVKVNAVVVGGFNDHDLHRMVAHFEPYGDAVHIRFIERMPFGGDRRQHVPADLIRRRLEEHYTLVAEHVDGGGPATGYRVVETGQLLGFISPMTAHFCEACNRLRLMCDGHLRTCLSRDDTPSLRDMIRDGVSQATLQRAIRMMVWGKVAGHEAHLGEDGWRAFEGVMTRIGG